MTLPIKRLLFLCILLGYGGFFNLAIAQVGTKPRPLTLSNGLDQIAKDFQVNFIYESSLLSGKAIAIDADQQKERKLTEILSDMLAPFSIGYYQIDKRNYALFQQPEIGKEAILKDFLAPGVSKVENGLSTINGSVCDRSGRPLEYSTVYLLGMDSTSVATTIADSLGRYRFTSVGSGSYKIRVTRLGHQPAHSQIFYFAAVGVITLKDLVLVEDPGQLSQVMVMANQPLFQYLADRTIINLDGKFLGTGLTISDLLEISPGVSMINDQISFRANQDLKVMIDGTQVKLSGSQLTGLFRGMPIGAVSQIEIIHSPSAKYDAQGEGGIINIKMAAQDRVGLSGTFNSLFSIGSQPKFTEIAAINYSSGKFSLYGNYSYQNLINDTELITNNVVYGTPKRYDQRQERGRSNSTIHSGMSGINYQIDRKNLVSIKATVNTDYNRSKFSRIFLSNGLEGMPSDSSIRSLNRGSLSVHSYSLEMNSSHTLGSKGDLLSFYAGYTKFRSKDEDGYSNSYFGFFKPPIANEEQLSNDAHVDLSLLSVGADYSLPINKGHQLEAGGKLVFNHSNSGILFQSEIPNAQLLGDLSLTSNFEYREKISAFYLNYEGKIGSRTNLRLGLRAENTNYTSAAISGDQIANQNYTQLFPNFMLSRNIGKQLFSLSYLRSVGRPTYQDLNPFVTYFSPYSYAIGNQFLKPETTHSLELGYGYGIALNFTLKYSHTDNYLGWIVSLDPGKFSTRQHMGNFGQYENFTLSANYQKSLFRFWKLVGGGSLFHDSYQDVYLGYPIQSRLFGFSLNVMSNLQIHPKLTLDIFHIYQSKRTQLAGTVLGRYRADASLKYGFYRGRASMRIAVTDIFFKYLDQGTSYFDQLNTSYVKKNENRRFHLGLTYNFGRKDLKEYKIKDNKEQLDRIK